MKQLPKAISDSFLPSSQFPSTNQGVEDFDRLMLEREAEELLHFFDQYIQQTSSQDVFQ
jgi:hypothetical protein